MRISFAIASGAAALVGDLSATEAQTVEQDMAAAGKADAANDPAGCEKALADVRRILGVLAKRGPSRHVGAAEVS
jgi:hypothetical protein